MKTIFATLLFSLGCAVAKADHYQVYVLAGQSNMDGRGHATDLSQEQRSPFQDAIIFYRNAEISSDGWQPLSTGYSLPPGFKGKLPSPTFGPEIGFTKSMLAASRGSKSDSAKLAIIKGSKGGTSLRKDWNPGKRGEPASQGPRYRDMIETIGRASDELKQRGDSFEIRGMLWHQGESDSKSSSELHQERLADFVARFREDVGVVNLPVVVGQVFDNGKRDGVRAAIQSIAASDLHVGLVTAEGLTTWDDGTHFDAVSQLKMGQRFADQMLTLQGRSLASQDDPDDNDEVTKYQHSFIAFGQKTYMVDGTGQKTWTYPHATRDGYLLADGRKILTLNKGKRYTGGAVIQIAPDGTETLIWKGTQSEVNGAHPTKDGTFVITEAGDLPRLVEVDLSGTVLVEFPLQCQKKNHHLQTRMARKLDDGTYLVPHLLDFAVLNYDSEGKVLHKIDTSVAGDTERKIHSWPFTAIRHGNGHTMVCCTNGNRVVDFDADGKIAWQLTNEELPGPWLQDPCGGQVLPNGNFVIACYAGGRKDPQAPKLFEITREKQVVWTYRDGQKSGIHHFQILDTNGKNLTGPILK